MHIFLWFLTRVHRGNEILQPCPYESSTSSQFPSSSSLKPAQKFVNSFSCEERRGVYFVGKGLLITVDGTFFRFLKICFCDQYSLQKRTFFIFSGAKTTWERSSPIHESSSTGVARAAFICPMKKCWTLFLPLLTMPYRRSRARKRIDSSLSSRHIMMRSLCPWTLLGWVLRIFDIAKSPRYFTEKRVFSSGEVSFRFLVHNEKLLDENLQFWSESSIRIRSFCTQSWKSRFVANFQNMFHASLGHLHLKLWCFLTKLLFYHDNQINRTLTHCSQGNFNPTKFTNPETMLEIRKAWFKFTKLKTRTVLHECIFFVTKIFPTQIDSDQPKTECKHSAQRAISILHVKRLSQKVKLQEF